MRLGSKNAQLLVDILYTIIYNGVVSNKKPLVDPYAPHDEQTRQMLDHNLHLKNLVARKAPEEKARMIAVKMTDEEWSKFSKTVKSQGFTTHGRGGGDKPATGAFVSELIRQLMAEAEEDDPIR